MPGDYLKIGQYKYAGAGKDLTAGRYGADGREKTEECVSLPERLEANRESRKQARLLARGGQSDQAGGVMDFFA